MSTLIRLLLLERLSAGADIALLALRLFVGSFLIWGVWDNIVSAERMEEFERFLHAHGFVMPHLMAPLSVWTQFFCGIAFILGLATRWAGLICVCNFLVALAMVDAKGGLRAALPATLLLLLGLYWATHGAGRFSLDRLLSRAVRP